MKLQEKFFNTVQNLTLVSTHKLATFDIYINPTSKELREVETWNRGYIDRHGNLYISAIQDIIHIDLLRGLNKLKGVDYPEILGFANKQNVVNVLNMGICVQRIKDTKSFYLSEAYQTTVINANIDKITALLELAKEKNPYLFFNLEVVPK